MKLSHLIGCCVVGFVLSITGCAEKGPKLGTVTGVVTLDGDPVEGAMVQFLPLFPGGVEATSVERTDADGRFEMMYSVDRMGCLVGNHSVQITTQDWLKQPDGSNKIVKERIPAHYIGLKSILEFDVQEGENTANFELTKKKPK